jgi:integrase
MAVYKRGGVWWFGFTFNGERIQQSTKQGSKRVAEQMEAACRTRLAKGEVGIVDRKPVPVLKEFAPRFSEAIGVRCAEKPRTVSFYREKLARLLEYQPLASGRLDEIDEALIEGYIQERRKQVAPATVNRQLATLRRLLRLAYEWKVIGRVPRIRLLPGERNRDFVLSHDQEKLYLDMTTQPLHDVALLILDTGLRVGEALALEWRDIHHDPAIGAKFGYPQVREGKSKNARRTVSLTARVSALLKKRATSSMSTYVFPGRTEQPFIGTSLNHQHQRARRLLRLPKDFVIHSLRHTMLTRLGEAGVDAFTIMRIAGHSSITVSQRYVHPSSEAMERAFERLEQLNGRIEEKTANGMVLRGPTTVSTTIGTAPVVTH